MIKGHELTDADRVLIEAARNIVRLRHVPRWNSVGAAMRTRAGRTYVAIHLDAAVGRVAVCAEMIALGMAVAEGDLPIDCIVAVAWHGEDDWEVLPPCGMCRELLSDYAPDASVIVPMSGALAKVVLSDLLPIKQESAEKYPPPRERRAATQSQPASRRAQH